MFKDATGAFSIMRVCMFMVVITVCTIYVIQNIISMFHGQGLVSFGVTEISALGLIFAAKVGQNITENVNTENASITEDSAEAPSKPAS